MAKIEFKKLEANTPGKDTRGKKPDFKAKCDMPSFKKAVMGRTKSK